MTEHEVGTREEWQTARDELAGLEAEHAELGRKAAEKRREHPWVPVEKKYVFDTVEGHETHAELFDERTELLAHTMMFGLDHVVGARAGYTGLADGPDATLVH